jgi:hypothetical protein
MRRIPLILTLATFAAALAHTATPAGAVPSRSTTIAVEAASIQDDQIVQNIGIAPATRVGAGKITYNPFSITKKVDR